jgi:hypothetical protein
MEAVMNRPAVIVGTLTLAGALWIGVSAQQEMQARPGPGSGVMDVRVINHPAVTAAQSGAWEVALAAPADVRVINNANVTVSRPSFVQLNTRYRVTWSATETETVRVVAAASGGWVQVSSSGGDRWINLDQARSVDVAR